MPLREQSLSDIADMVPTDAQWYFVSLEGMKQTWIMDGDLPYEYFFHITEFSELSQPCNINDLIAATDNARNFGISLSFE